MPGSGRRPRLGRGGGSSITPPAMENGHDSLWTLLMLALLAGLFFVWKRVTKR